ncbi:MAG: hypothetical protein QW478_07830 [Candidatus Micrarchaeaceae archaeon]
MKVKFRIKPKRIMKEYIALNYLTPYLAKRYHIPKNEVWVREGYIKNKRDMKRLKTHELVELNLMKRGLKYQKAHRIANKFEKKVKT